MVSGRSARLGRLPPDHLTWNRFGIPDLIVVALSAMSKRTQKKKNNARRKKANHGRKPNLGRNS